MATPYEVIRCYNGVPFLLEGHLTAWSAASANSYIPWPQPCAEVRGCAWSCPGVRTGPIHTVFAGARSSADRALSAAGSEAHLRAVLPAALPATAVHSPGISAAIPLDIRWHRCDIKTTSLVASVLQKIRAGRRCRKTHLSRGKVSSRRVWKGTCSSLGTASLQLPLRADISPGISRQLCSALPRGDVCPCRSRLSLTSRYIRC